jgi:hypothetical protein
MSDFKVGQHVPVKFLAAGLREALGNTVATETLALQQSPSRKPTYHWYSWTDFHIL